MSLRQSGSILLRLTGSKCVRTCRISKATRMSPKSIGTKSTKRPMVQLLSTIRRRLMRPTSPPKSKTAQSRQVNTVSRCSTKRMVRAMLISQACSLNPALTNRGVAFAGGPFLPVKAACAYKVSRSLTPLECQPQDILLSK